MAQNNLSFITALLAPGSAQSAAYNSWLTNTFLPQVYQATGAPGQSSMKEILKQYSSISRTPSGLGFGVPYEFQGCESMMVGFLCMSAETYSSTPHGTKMGPFEVRKMEEGGGGVVRMECVKKVGEVEKVVATWRFVKKTVSGEGLCRVLRPGVGTYWDGAGWKVGKTSESWFTDTLYS